MPLSIWEYLRERTRDAVLAGFQDALDIAEQGDTNGSQHDAAKRLRERLSAGSLSSSVETKSLPHSSVHGRAAASSDGPSSSLVTEKAPSNLQDASAFNDELGDRLNAAAAPNGREPLSSALNVQRPKRGRPPKKSQP